MKQSNIPIAFFGTPGFAQIVLEKLINSPYKPLIVITAPDTKFGRGQKIVSTPVKQTAVRNNIKVIEPNFLNHQSTINNQQFDLAILVAYGKIIPKEILKIPKYGFINVHPSILPKYRGPSPIQSAILSGEKKTGVTIMLLDEEIDHGPILAQKEIMVNPNDNNEVLHEKLGVVGAELLIEALPRYLAHLRGVKNFHLGGEVKDTRIFIPPKPQNHSIATFTKHITRNDGHVDLNSPPSKELLDRMIRAFHPWPGVYTELRIKNYELRIKLLPGGKIQPQGKKPMTKKEFLNGYPLAKNFVEEYLS